MGLIDKIRDLIEGAIAEFVDVDGLDEWGVRHDADVEIYVSPRLEAAIDARARA